MAMIYITIDNADHVTECIDSDRQAIPGGAIQLTPIEARMIATHPIGFDAFDYIGGALVENAPAAAARTLERNRRAKIREVRDYATGLIGSVIPALASTDTMDLVIELFQAGAFAAGFPTPGSDMERVKDIYVYARGRINLAKTATQAQLDAYDVEADPNWP